MVATYHIRLPAFGALFPFGGKGYAAQQQYNTTPKPLYAKRYTQAAEYKQAKAQPGEQQREECEKHTNNPNLPKGY